jgi:hypothetical protein
MALIINCIFAAVYWNARNNAQDQVMSKAWLVVWYNTVPAMSKSVK